tara:strand:- start:1433 stop:2395 length:963 start_codon:yes stop_codon:yes gene_type:complete
MAGKIPKNKKEAVIEAGKFIRGLFGGGGKKKVSPLPEEYPMVGREATGRAAKKSYDDKQKIWDNQEVVKYRGRPYIRSGGIPSKSAKPKNLTWKEAYAMATDKSGLPAARKANQPVGRTKQDRLREFVEAGGVNAHKGDFVSDEATKRAIARLKKGTRKATPAEAELIPKLNKDEFEAALKTQPSSKAALAKRLQKEKDQVARENTWIEEIEQELDVLGGFGGPEQVERWYIPLPPSGGWKNKNDMKRAYTARILGNDPKSRNYKIGYNEMAAKVKARRAAEKQAQSFNEAVEEQLEFDFEPKKTTLKDFIKDHLRDQQP